MVKIPDSHPRKKSLISRAKIVNGSNEGLLADSALIAHGRGEAFDYLLGEKTSKIAKLAIREVSARLKAAKKPVISVNGNTVVLAGEYCIRVAAALGCPVEVNLYYTTPARVSGLISLLEEQRRKVLSEDSGMGNDWEKKIMSVDFLGLETDYKIVGLEGPRANCCKAGIGDADSILVPIEDGDRCEALVKASKEVLVIDLNPLSRTARMATVTIVDEVSRAFEKIYNEVITSNYSPSEWDNISALNESLKKISSSFI